MKIVAANEEIIAIQMSVQENLLTIVDIDNEMLDSSLPEVVNQYVRLSLDSDEIRADLIELALKISNARRDLAEISGMRAEFDNCLAAVDWTKADKEVSDAVTACSSKIPAMLAATKKMEKDYEAELDQLTTYLTLLKEQWDANAAYYLAISQQDYNGANEHDVIFVDRKRQISELNVGAAFGEFYEEVITELLKDFEELKETELEKEALVDEWYNRNINR